MGLTEYIFCHVELLAEHPERGGIFLRRAGVNPAGSGGGGPLVDDTDDLIDGERDDAEHEMAFDLECAADAEKSGAELVFQTGVDAFGHGAEIVDQVVEVGHVDELQALDLAAPFGLALVVGAKVAVDDGGVAERPALVVDRGGVVGGVHEIVEIGDAGARHGHQGNGDLAVVDGGRGQHAGDRDLAAGHVDVEFVAGPGLFVALAVFLAADVAGGGQVGEHLAEVLHDLPLETRRLRLRPRFVLAWTSALARRRGIIGRRRIVFAVVGLVVDRLLARFDLGGVARDRPDDASPGGFMDKNRGPEAALMRAAAIGWITSWAIEAVNSPKLATRARWASSAMRASSSFCAAWTRSVMSRVILVKPTSWSLSSFTASITT